MISRNFIRDSAIYTIAGALPMASAIILLPFYLAYLSPATFGAVSIYTGISLLVQIFVTLSFDASIYIFFHDYKNEPGKLALYLSSSFNFIICMGLGMLGILSFTGTWIFQQVFSEVKIEFFPFGLIAAFTGIFQAIFTVHNKLLQTQQKAVEFLIANIVSFSLTAFFVIVGMYFLPDQLFGPLGGRLLAFFISAAWVMIKVYSRFGVAFNFSILKSTLGYNVPSFLYQVLQWLNNYFDKILMTFFLPLSVIGNYDLAVKCMLAIDFLLTGLNSSFFPKVLSQLSQQKEKSTTVEINRYYNGLTGVAILAVIGTIAVVPFIDFFFSKSSYAAAIAILPYAAIVYLMRPLRLWVAMPYAALKYSKPLPVYYLFIAALKIGSLYVLVQKMGVYGAIASALITYVFEIVVLYLGARKRFRLQFNIFKLVMAPLIVGLSILILEPLFGTTYTWWVHGFYVILGGGVLLWGFRNELKVIRWPLPQKEK